MSSFTIRVELHNAQAQHYTELEKDLAKQGITDVIVADDGSCYKLPPAEYNYIGQGSIDDVLNATRASAARTGKANAVFVTEAVRRKWQGLNIVQARRFA